MAGLVATEARTVSLHHALSIFLRLRGSSTGYTTCGARPVSCRPSHTATVRSRAAAISSASNSAGVVVHPSSRYWSCTTAALLAQAATVSVSLDAVSTHVRDPGTMLGARGARPGRNPPVLYAAPGALHSKRGTGHTRR